jgi:hypothetical protein
MRWRKAQAEREAAVARGENPPPYRRTLPIGSCLAYAPDSEVVRRAQQPAEE